MLRDQPTRPRPALVDRWLPTLGVQLVGEPAPWWPEFSGRVSREALARLRARVARGVGRHVGVNFHGGEPEFTMRGTALHFSAMRSRGLRRAATVIAEMRAELRELFNKCPRCGLSL